MKKQKILKWFILSIAVAINLFILINAFINGEASAKESNGIAQTFANIINAFRADTVTQENFEHFAFYIRKAVGHFGLFAFSGLFTTWSLYLFIKETKAGYFLWQMLMSLGFGFVVAVVSEFVQIFVDGRYGAWTDVGIDFSGYFIGFSLIFLILLLRKSPIFWMKNYMKNQAE